MPSLPFETRARTFPFCGTDWSTRAPQGEDGCAHAEPRLVIEPFPHYRFTISNSHTSSFPRRIFASGLCIFVLPAFAEASAGQVTWPPEPWRRPPTPRSRGSEAPRGAHWSSITLARRDSRVCETRRIPLRPGRRPSALHRGDFRPRDYASSPAGATAGSASRRARGRTVRPSRVPHLPRRGSRRSHGTPLPRSAFRIVSGDAPR
jgi:hypothetical protein